MSLCGEVGKHFIYYCVIAYWGAVVIFIISDSVYVNF
jgi:hypothetical protein